MNWIRGGIELTFLKDCCRDQMVNNRCNYCTIPGLLLGSILSCTTENEERITTAGLPQSALPPYPCTSPINQECSGFSLADNEHVSNPIWPSKITISRTNDTNSTSTILPHQHTIAMRYLFRNTPHPRDLPRRILTRQFMRSQPTVGRRRAIRNQGRMWSRQLLFRHTQQAIM